MVVTAAAAAAGTYEEKDQLEWAEARLIALLTEDGGSFTKVYEVEGDALYTFRKGKKGQIFDLNFVRPLTQRTLAPRIPA